MGIGSRSMTDKEEKILQSIIDDHYQQFFNVVLNSRNITAEKLRDIAQGQVYAARQAKELGLIDNLGDLNDTINLVKKDLNISGKPQIISHKTRRSFFSLLENLMPTTELDFLKRFGAFESLKFEYLMVP